MQSRFLEAVAIRLSAAGAATGTTAINGTAVDMAGFDSVVFVATIATANAGNFLKGQQGDLADGSDAQDLAGSKVVAAANGQVVALEIYKPKDRYVRPVIIRAGATTVTGDVYALLFKGTPAPVTNQITNTLLTLGLVTPAEGTP